MPDSAEPCQCAHLSDVLIRFQDGSLKRPDIAIFCAEPPDQDEAIRDSECVGLGSHLLADQIEGATFCLIWPIGSWQHSSA